MGHGSFGIVYRGVDTEPNRRSAACRAALPTNVVALKVALQDDERAKGAKEKARLRSRAVYEYGGRGHTVRVPGAYRLKHESMVLCELQHVRNVPRVVWHGVIPHFRGCALPLSASSSRPGETPSVSSRRVLRSDSDRVARGILEARPRYVLVTELLGRSLGDYMEPSLGGGRRGTPAPLPLGTVLRITIDMIRILRDVHAAGILHRDIKPDNILTGGETYGPGHIFLADFGLARRYLMPDGSHTPFMEAKAFAGTPRYASANAHMGAEQGRRDDLESLMYVVIYLARGSLPWQGIRAPDYPSKMAQIKERKLVTEARDVAKGLPYAFVKALEEVKELGFDDAPRYDRLVGYFEREARRRRVALSGPLDFGLG